MRKLLLALSLCSMLGAILLEAHPLGNFSVNRYMKFDAGARGVELKYAIDLAEIPTFEMLRDWGLTASSPREQLDARAAEQARAWMKNLSIQVDGAAVEPGFESAELAITDGAGNLPVARITTKMKVVAVPGYLKYEDRNFEGRAGWKEIVIGAGHVGTGMVRIDSASQGDQDRSQALTAYPPNPLEAPPQDLRAEFQWSADAPLMTSTPAKSPTHAQIVRPIAQPVSTPAPTPAALTAKNAPAGTVVRNDFLSKLLRREQIPFNMILIAMVVAFGLGGAHALTPGHGKTIVAAYLVGSRGTMKHAVLLGAMVTLTHTISVFALGFATLFLFRFIVPEKITEILGVVSGLSILLLGAWMLLKRLRHRAAPAHHHHHHGEHHHHDHAHGHTHSHDEQHAHDHRHGHARDHSHSHGEQHAHDHHHNHTADHTHDQAHGHDHHHHDGPGGHSHVPEGDITWGNLITLAVSGGMVPCESALVLLLSAVALGRVGLGLLLLLAFSLGLAGVLMATGMVVLFAKRALPQRSAGHRSPWVKWVPVGSAAMVTLIGVVLTGVSLGWLPSRWLIG
jgi:nickel/cobalt transporter (NicO) family protein